MPLECCLSVPDAIRTVPVEMVVLQREITFSPVFVSV